MSSWRTRGAVLVGRAAAGASRALGRGGGSVIGGRAVLALAPGALTELAADLSCVLVSGTNGKTTSTRLLAAALAEEGPVVSNVEGANMPAGLVGALARRPPGARRAALEVDEPHLPAVAAAVRPSAVVLLNLSRDQLDRVSEVARVAARWRAALTGQPPPVVVANADDPLVAWAADPAPEVVWVGAGQTWTADSSLCPWCHAPLARPEGRWRCTTCGRARPDLAWALQTGDGAAPRVCGPGGLAEPLGLALPGRANAANAVMALACAQRLGVPPEAALRRLRDVASVAGRYAVVRIDGRYPVRLLLAKNPAGWGELFDVLSPAPAPVVVAINARAADGRDPSWLWDVPFERLAGRQVVATGDRRRDLAVRLLYAGVAHTVRADPWADGGPDGLTGGAPVDVVANYTAFHDLLRRTHG